MRNMRRLIAVSILGAFIMTFTVAGISLLGQLDAASTSSIAAGVREAFQSRCSCGDDAVASCNLTNNSGLGAIESGFESAPGGTSGLLFVSSAVSGGFDMLALAGTAGLAGIVVLILKAFSLSFLPLYSRIERDEVLDHPMRKKILEHIQCNPGVSFSKLMENLDIKNGVLAYHLRTLEKAEMIKSVRQGSFRCYFAANARAMPQELETRILDTIRSNPGVCQSELAKMLDESRQVVNYHVTQMLRDGKLWYKTSGRRIELFARYNVC